MEENGGMQKRGRGGRTRGRGRGRGGRGRGRGRGKKVTKVIESDEEEDCRIGEVETIAPVEDDHQIIDATAIIDEDITKLEMPTFTTITDRGPPKPVTLLNWDHIVNLIGHKVQSPMIFCCEKCRMPILIYGRMLPCKHVFCLSCARKHEKKCPRCEDKVSRIEQAGLTDVFMCLHGGSRYDNNGCRRTYLSERDLQAHIQYRHVNKPQSGSMSSTANESVAVPQPVAPPLQSPVKIDHEKDPSRIPHVSPGDPRIMAHAAGPAEGVRRSSTGGSDIDMRSRSLHMPTSHVGHQILHQPVSSENYTPQVSQGQYHAPSRTAPSFSQPSPIPVMNTRSSNLITIPIQDNTETVPASSYQPRQNAPFPPPASYQGYSNMTTYSVNSTPTAPPPQYTQPPPVYPYQQSGTPPYSQTQVGPAVSQPYSAAHPQPPYDPNQQYSAQWQNMPHRHPPPTSMGPPNAPSYYH